MASIPGWVYLIVGGAVAGFSKYIGAKMEKAPGALTIFFWIGILLVAVGVFKLALGYMTGEKEQKPETKAPVRGPGRPDYARDAIVCPRCNARLHPQSRFCNWCGTRQ
jgi:hypothetical protein